MPSHSPTARTHAAAVALVAAATLAVFAQTFNDEFISLDDGQYLTLNENITGRLTSDELRYALTDTSIANWHPVTMLSHALMAAAFGKDDPTPHHLANLALHLANALLLYAVLFRMTGAFWPSLVGALVFAVHPLRAESVAWVSERKGLLSAFFGLLTLLAYERFARNPTIWRCIPVVIAFVLGLLSKPALVALPFALLLLDAWPLDRIHKEPGRRLRCLIHVVAEKLPLIAASVAITAITFIAQRSSGAIQTLANYSLPVRIANAVESYGMYVLNTLAPFHLALYYPHPRETVFHSPGLYVSAILLIAITAFALAVYKSRPWFIVGWLWFIGMLVPAIGLVQLADQARADRYTYLPQLGLLIIIAWTLDEIRRKLPARVASGGVALWIVALAVAGFIQTSRWQDDYTLFTYTVARAPSSPPAHYGLGVAHLKRNDLSAAEQEFLEAVALEPPAVFQAHSNLGAIALRRGDFPAALQYFTQADAIRTNEPDLMVNLGIALFNLGRPAEALAQADAVLALDPAHPRALELRQACQDLLTRGPAPR